MISTLASFAFGNRFMSSISTLVMVSVALFGWHKIDKTSAVRSAVANYVADVELEAARAEIKEANRRLQVSEKTSAALAQRLTELDALAAANISEIEEYAESLEDIPACRPDDAFLDGLLTR
tara:strand:- start:16642 stop:17007 length:366 start_codon:yes stop_codon:yes gene_type:complete